LVVARWARDHEAGGSNLPPVASCGGPSPLLVWGVFGVVLCFGFLVWGCFAVAFGGGFGYCFATVQLLVCLSGSGLVLGFRCCSFGGGVCGCQNRSACVAHNPEVDSSNLPPLFFFARLRVVLRVFRHRVHCSVSGDLCSEILVS
jgi:hypothetical protein